MTKAERDLLLLVAETVAMDQYDHGTMDLAGRISARFMIVLQEMKDRGELNAGRASDRQGGNQRTNDSTAREHD